MRKILFTLIAISMLFPVYSHAQIPFEKWFGGDDSDAGLSVQQTTDGGYVIVGYTQSFGAGEMDVYLIKTDSLGVMTWSETYGGEDRDEGNSVQQTTEGGYIIVGATRFSGSDDYDVYLIKIDSSGDTTWTRTYGGDEMDMGYSVQQTFPDSGYIITGFAGGTGSFGTDNTDVYLIKTDSSGDTIWTRTYGGSDDDFGLSVQQATDGGYIITGEFGGFGGLVGDVYLIKTDSSGDTTWTRTYGGEREEFGTSVQQTEDGGYIIVGVTNPFSDTLYSEVYLIKTDSSGDTTWTRKYNNGEDGDRGNSVQQTEDGGYIVGGVASMYSNNSDALLIKIDSSGVEEWRRTFGGDEMEDFVSVQQTRDRGYIATGWTWSFGMGYSDVYLVKTNADGSVGIIPEDTIPVRLPKSFSLSQNYPNPFNPSTTISFDIPGNAGKKQPVNLTIYDIRGRRVQTLIDSDLEPGKHKVHWNGRNNKGEQVSSGIYLYTLKTKEGTFTHKMTVLK
jgi:hypothetical protein